MAKNTKISKIKETEVTSTSITSVIGGNNISTSGGTDVTVNLDSNISVSSINTEDIKSNTDINLNLDADGDGTNAVKIKDHAGNVVCSIDESGDLTITGKIVSTYASRSSGGNILVEDSGEVKSKTTSELKTDLLLNNVENKSSATIRGEIVAGNIPNLATSKITSGTFDAARIPTLNQNTTGSAASLTTERDLQVDLSSTNSDGFDGSGNATDIGVKNTLAVGNGGTGVTSLSSLYAYQYLNWEVNTNSFTGTNYELPAANGGFGSDSFTINSGLARNTAIDGTVTMSLASNLQQQGWFVPHACKLIAVSGAFRNNGSEGNPRDVAIFVGTPDIGSSNSSTYTQRLFAAGDVDGGAANSKIYKVNTVLGTPFSLSAGDIVMPAVCNSTGSSTIAMQGNFNIIIATSIFTI